MTHNPHRVGDRVKNGTFNAKGRWIPDAPYNEPFYSFGGDGAWRNGRQLGARGFYLIDNDGDLHGPFKTRTDAMGAKST